MMSFLEEEKGVATPAAARSQFLSDRPTERARPPSSLSHLNAVAGDDDERPRRRRRRRRKKDESRWRWWSCCVDEEEEDTRTGAFLIAVHMDRVK